MMAERLTSLRGEMRLNEPMAAHTSWRVGGPARRYYRPADVDDLAEFLSGLPSEEPVLWVGLGSNLLVRDGGIPGTVIAPFGGLGAVEALDETTLRVEAGVACAKVARQCARRGLIGGEFLAGIPGTMGGALAMNAGAFGGEIWDRVLAVETLDHAGVRHRRGPGEYRIAYRSVQGPAGEWFIAAHLKFEPGDAKAAQARIRELLEHRNLTQPTQQASCGSVFRNPPGDHAARLIETAGLKGVCVGGACVSQKHANFIVNTGAARAADIESLIEEVQETVERVHGVRLQREVHIVGVANGQPSGRRS
ncbi:MAG: UDP-N-acetylmuramate dehydrogenase [Gammaproteobacteria bacterium]